MLVVAGAQEWQSLLSQYGALVPGCSWLGSLGGTSTSAEKAESKAREELQGFKLGQVRRSPSPEWS